MLLLKMRPPETKLDTRYRTDPRTRTKLHTAQHPTRTVLKQKQILKVYQKGDQLFVDNSTAFALGLTKVRAIMVDNPIYVPVTSEQLEAFKSQNNDTLDINIEYHNLAEDIDVETPTKDRELEKALDKLEKGKFGIGVHGIDSGNLEQKEQTASTIQQTKFDLTNRSQTILSNAISLGPLSDAHTQTDEIRNYQYGSGPKCNVIFAVPDFIQNSNGEKIYLGFPERNLGTAAQQYQPHCILDRICSNLGYIPSEFILGYYSKDGDQPGSFESNSSHISMLPNEDIDTLFSTLSSGIDPITRDMNDMILQGKIEQLNQSLKILESRNLDTHLIKNCISLAEKYPPKRKRIINLSTIKKAVADHQKDAEI